jgi:hypothetical protein
VTPKSGDFEKLSQIVETRERDALNITSEYKFNETLGWGHVMAPPNDGYKLRNGKTDFLWNFLFAYSDQGLRKCGSVNCSERSFESRNARALCLTNTLTRFFCAFILTSISLGQICQKNREFHL